MGNESRGRSSAIPTVLLGAAAGLGPFTIDAYLPALPAISEQLSISAETSQFSLAVTMLGFAVGQLVVGPWSDHAGRRLPLATGLVLLVLGSIAAGLANDAALLLLSRFVQGFGAASSAVTALAAARDQYEGPRLVKAIGTIALIQSLAPLVAPVIGGFVLVWSSWRGVFVFLAIYALAILASTVPRLRAPAGTAGPMVPVLARYRRLARDRSLVILLSLAALRFIALFSFLQWSPFIFQGAYGTSPSAFGMLFAVMTLGMMIGLQLSPFSIRRGAPPRSVLQVSYLVMLVSAGLIALLSGAAITVASCALFLIGCGLGLPTIQTLALADHPEDAGTVAGLVGAVGFGAAGLLSPVLAGLPALGLDYQQALAVVILVVAVLSAALTLALRIPPKNPLL